MYGFIFPGQGSQQVGMGQFLYKNFTSVKHLFEEASDTLNIDFKSLCFEDPKDQLNLTQNTQPALLLVSTAYFKVIQEIKPTNVSAFAGHSIGEYAACVNANALSFSQALSTVEKRGLWMQEAVPVGKGSMAALLGFSEEQVSDICKWAQEKSGHQPVEPANYNSPGQIVISGDAMAIDFICKNMSKEDWPYISSTEAPRRLKAIPLKVSAPFHCSLMQPAQEKMQKLLNNLEFQDTSTPIVQNVDGKAYTDKNKLKQNLTTQVSAPVRWTSCMDTFNEMGIENIIECGHGQVLQGLLKKMPHPFKVTNFNSLEDIKNFEKDNNCI
ncbi:MAG: ACP S-malonyltransferase [Bdellovibrionaceae bacterium]|jgi:[acyl-carrier-protein] S-malonyltransferase|nr:ACP S-malonyltransferase [Pseudobdellovibrionaceae bacterium]